MCLIYTVYAGCGHRVGGEVEPCPSARYPDACADSKKEDRKVQIMCTRCRQYYGVDYKPQLEALMAAHMAAEPKKAESKEAESKDKEGKDK
ncbi:hypothetical protein GX51_02432 [Blastomyces parvus]|uniref:Uncharacterized protein n=1 Tax=Blastomyces parvus TaxID=2060905 RepID=A0A2B7XC22_9EURO|nr:hypothetical protein GX51_02432 [Blastomyces parvus]